MSLRKCVTVEECQKCNNLITDDLKTIKTALIGEDLLGGLVFQVNEITASLQLLKEKASAQAGHDEKEKDVKRESSTRWKLAVFTVVSGLIGVFIGLIVRLL
jgi:hypothetical protein